MALTSFTAPINGLWPLGQITVATAGTPVALNINVGAQTQTVPGQRPTPLGTQILLTTNSGTGYIYLIRKCAGVTVSKSTPGFVVAVFSAGGGAALIPSVAMRSPAINVDDYVIDADNNSTSVYASMVIEPA